MDSELLTNTINSNTSSIDLANVTNLMSEASHSDVSIEENISKVLTKEERKERRAQAREQKKKAALQSKQELYFENDAQAKRYQRARQVKLGFIYAFLVLCALLTLIPFYWMINTSLKTYDELIRIPATFFPENPVFENYVTAFTTENGLLLRYIGNTLLVAVLTMLLSVVTTTLAAFAFARLEFKGRELLFSLLLATMMIPGEMMIMTNFTTVASLGGLDSYWALIIPFGTSVFYMFFLRQNFKQIPNELYYAAKVDGNSDFKYFFRVMIPIARPALITVIILSMIGSWNAYLWPRTVSQGDEMKLITDGLLSLFSTDMGGDTSNIRMAATTIVSIPLLLAFAFFKKYIMRGVSRSGIKG